MDFALIVLFRGVTVFIIAPSRSLMARFDPHSNLEEGLRNLLIQSGFSEDVPLPSDVPKKWERFDDVVILPPSAFVSEFWDCVSEASLWVCVARCLGAERVFRKGEVDGPMRKPMIEPLLMNSRGGWAVRKENGIRYGYDILQCMWSAGNVNERRRMRQIAKKGERILDMFAGIGYYTLPSLMADPSITVWSCEWNDAAIEALRWNLKENNVESQCTILEGDCRETVTSSDLEVDRIILGLLPDATSAVDAAIGAMSEKGGMIHLHGLAASGEYDHYSSNWISEIQIASNDYDIRPAALHRVKSYAPRWDHVVLDLNLIPHHDYE